MQLKARDRYLFDIPFVAPRTPLEGALATIWRDVLAVDKVGVNDNFFDLEGDSLLGTQIATRVRQQLGRLIDLSEVLEAPTVAELAAHLRESAASMKAR